MSKVSEILVGSNKVNASTNLFKCADRVSPGDEPADITIIKEKYIPFDVAHKEVHLRKNPFGTVIYRQQAMAGNIYQAFDGKRLVIEVGCQTVIHINMAQPKKTSSLISSINICIFC